MNSTPTNYNSQYYEQNKDEISEKRRSRYHEDEEYRQKAMERAKEYYKRNRDKIRKKNRKKTVVLWPDGHTEAALQIAELGERIDKKPFTIRTWIRKGLIPDSPIRRNRIRYYTPKMITVVANAMPDTFRKDWDAITEKIERGWERVGAYDPDLQVTSI
jgi:DNA-binding transcriptional MerR regulator